jgi:hypothetical protein
VTTRDLEPWRSLMLEQRLLLDAERRLRGNPPRDALCKCGHAGHAHFHGDERLYWPTRHGPPIRVIVDVCGACRCMLFEGAGES